MWCDSKEHGKRECQKLSTALKKERVKFVGESSMKKIVFYDTDVPIPLNNNKGEMKVLVEKHLREREVEMATAAFEPNMFNAHWDKKDEGAMDVASKQEVS
ncbi:unnamed protein product [Calypogeia fissa]